MPLQDDMHLISVDDHLIEHQRVWLDRMPDKYLERCPQVVESGDEGMYSEFGTYVKPHSQAWLYEGNIHAQMGLNAVAGKPPEALGLDPVRYEDMIPGCYDPVERVKDMDIDGVQAALCFPQFPKFAGTLFLKSEDMELARLCSQAWNDFVLDEWCATDPSRFIPLAILPFWDVERSVAEIHRVAAKGARAISFPENMVTLGLPSYHTDHWDPIFSAVEDADLPLCMHFGTSGKVPSTAPEAPLAVFISLMSCNSMYAVSDLIFSPVFHRHPKLKIAFSEGGIGWVPYLLERMDATWEKHRFYQNINQETRPSELFRKHMWACFIVDQHGLASRDEIGIDRLLWECDYPHSDSHWPNSRKVATEQFHDVPDEDVRQIVELNARELFHFPR
jgi:predicted TIM-barrel fold metal-dependent hydrolase